MLLVVYRPGSSAATEEFFDELHLVITAVSTSSCETIIVGDFNIHVDVATDGNAARLREVLSDHSLHQHVSQATHDRGHVLDLVITSEDTTPLSLTVTDLLASDHCLVTFWLPFTKPSALQTKYTCRRWANFDIDEFDREFSSE